MSVSINGTNGLTFNDGTTQATAWTPGWRNRIINGDMRIDQRNAGASVSTSGAFVTDRFKFNYSGGGTFSGQQATDSLPTGFSHALKFTVGTADTSIASTDEYIFDATIEGFNTADLLYGTASAQTTTISFWVRSSVTGTYAVTFKNSANSRAYPATYTVNAANTWEYKTITVAGDTSGTWIGATNGLGLRLRFCLAAGSSLLGTANSWQAGDLDGATGQANWMATSGNTFYITGVQLEKGSTATSFEQVEYGEMLRRCQRYFQVGIASQAVAQSTTSINGRAQLTQLMRATPSLGKTTGNFNFGDMVSIGYQSSATPTLLTYDYNNLNIAFNIGSFPASLVAYRSYRHEPTGGDNAVFTISAEL